MNEFEDHEASFLDQMADWIKEGKLRYRETLWPGLEEAPKDFRAMLDGDNLGRTIVAVGKDATLEVGAQGSVERNGGHDDRRRDHDHR